MATKPWIAFLAPDGAPDPRWLEALIRRARDTQEGDLVRSLVFDEGVQRERYALIETMNLCGRLVRIDGEEGDFTFSAAGAAMLFERAVYPVPLPDDYFLYHEDLHMSWRARLLGRSIVLCRESQLTHIGQASTKKVWAIAHFHGEKNRLSNFLTFWERRTRIRLLPLYAVDLLLHLPQGPETYAKAAMWVLRNRQQYRTRREEIQSKRVVPDRELIPLLSARLSPRQGTWSNAYNRLVLSYCRAFGLGTRETARP